MIAPIDRATMLKRGIGGAVVAFGAAALSPLARTAAGQASRGDADIVEYALLLEELEARFYLEALDKVSGLSSDARAVTETLAGHEDQHVSALKDVLENLGGRVQDPPRFDFGDAFRSEERYLEVAQTLEETGVGAYNYAGPLLVSKDILETAGGIVQVEARHAAAIRQLRGEPESPRAFDEPLDMATVRRRASAFVA